MQNQLSDYMNELDSHPVFNNDYFKFLGQHKLTPALYAAHRANFFFRTMATVIAIAHICANAATEHDQDTLILFSYILNEECGDGQKLRCHEQLMEQSHNRFAQFEFDLPPLLVKDLEGRSHGKRDDRAYALILDETKTYRTHIDALLGKNYRTMLGVAYALETHASIMLTNFRDMFGFNRHFMDEGEYKNKVEIYFNCHLDSGVEDRHAADARQCVLNNCNSANDLSDITFGIDQTLKIQEAMWKGMHRNAIQILNS